MSLRNSADAPSMAVAPEFQDRFVRDAHIIVAEGYSRLSPATLAKKCEERISEETVEHAEDWLSEPSAPLWTQSYFIKPEIRERRSPRTAKHRPRIDIYVESSAPRPRPRFAFEAKRLHRGGIAGYVGPDGLGAFLDGTYVPEATAAAMLGYVQNPAYVRCADQVRDKIDEDRARYGVVRWGANWTPTTLDARLGATWVSRHTRHVGTPISIYHSFLRCHAAAPTTRRKTRRAAF